MLDEMQISHIQKTFKKLELNDGSYATSFYDNLFEYAPFLKPIFSAPRELLEYNFRCLLRDTTNNIHNPAEVEAQLNTLGKLHAIKGIKLPHFKLVKAAFLLALQYELRNDYTVDVAKAWSDYCDLLAQALMEGMTISDTCSNKLQMF